MRQGRILVIGGAGFIGCSLADALLTDGQPVLIFDNLSRPGTTNNLEWLQQKHAQHLAFTLGDIRDTDALRRAMQGVDVVYHLAGQTAVTRSIADPRADFDVNALGTLNVLEAARATTPQPIVLFSSTNKVYGALEQAHVQENDTRYVLCDYPRGIDERWPLDFHSPYGCSKGAADQYVRDYSRIYGLRTIVFRQSCIYGPRQFGIEDQGWMAWFAIAAVLHRPITIYGNGKQVRDALHVKDLTRAMRMAVERIEQTAGQVYNIGGGDCHTISIWSEFGSLLNHILEADVQPLAFVAMRPGDQLIFVCDTSKAERDFGWSPTINISNGMVDVVEWIRNNTDAIAQTLGA